ncbi:hypothetical protein WT24_12930 [Burkholderia sp. MSMB1078WGS]|nr:hypothetical protein WT24_12930 [Burkholderia sp. MSMB1078WGS]
MNLRIRHSRFDYCATYGFRALKTELIRSLIGSDLVRMTNHFNFSSIYAIAAHLHNELTDFFTTRRIDVVVTGFSEGKQDIPFQDVIHIPRLSRRLHFSAYFGVHA